MKKFNKLFIIDGSFMLHRNLKVPELFDLKNDSGERSGGIFGVVRSLNYEIKNIDAPLVMVWDSGLSPRRLRVYPDYKRHEQRTAERILNKVDTPEEVEKELSYVAKRLNSESLERIRESINEAMRGGYVKDETPPEDDYVTQYHRQRDILITLLNKVGVPSIKINGWEGDDLITLLTRMCKECVVMTDDKDMIQLLAPNIKVRRPMHKDTLEYESYLKDNNFDSIREMIILKAITGDGSDNIPSVTSECERKFSLGATRGAKVAKLVYESNEDPEVYLPILSEMNKNYYKGFILHNKEFQRNMELVDLYRVPNDDQVMFTMASEILDKVGKSYILEAMKVLSAQGISVFDINGFVAKTSLIGSFLTYEECE